MSASQIWYVSYGSNMSRRRLGCYIEGGRPPAELLDPRLRLLEDPA